MTWQNNESVKKWFSEVSPRTVENCIRPFKAWLEFVDMSPDEQIKKRAKDLASGDPQTRAHFENRLIEWKIKLESETNEDGKRKYASTTIRSKLQRVQSFFGHSNVGLRFGKGQLKVEYAERERTERKWILNKIEVRQMYKRGSLDEKCRLLVLYQSGFASIDLCELRIEDFSDLYTAERHSYICKRRQKTDVWTQTCLSVEALHDIRLTLEKRGNPTEGFLLITRNGNQLTPKYLNESMKNLASLTFGDKAKQFKTHHLRDGYKGNLLRAKIPSEVVDCLFGHKRQGAKSAYQLERGLIEDSYETAFGYMSVNGGLQNRADYQQLKEMILERDITIKQIQTQLAHFEQIFETLLGSEDAHEKLETIFLLREQHKKQKST